MAPDRKVIIKIAYVFEKKQYSRSYGSKEKSPKREDAKNQLETMATDFSTFSIRKAASAVGGSATLVYHILHVKPYKYQEWHKLEDYVYEKR